MYSQSGISLYRCTIGKHKQELPEKDKKICVLKNNLNTKNNKNYVEDFAPEEEGFQCKICDKLYVSKDFLSSHIQNNHVSSKYSKEGRNILSEEFVENNLTTKSY